MARSSVFLALLIAAAAAIAAWPYFVANQSASAVAAGIPTAAPVNRDDLTRDAQVAFWEHAVGQRLPNDVLSPRNLSEQYLQRYRERGDLGDATRALATAQREERVAPHSPLADGATSRTSSPNKRSADCWVRPPGSHPPTDCGQ